MAAGAVVANKWGLLTRPLNCRDFRTSVNGILISGFASSWRKSVENSTDLFYKFNVHVEKYRFDGYFSHLTLGACKIVKIKYFYSRVRQGKG